MVNKKVMKEKGRKIKKRKFSLKQEYRESFNFLCKAKYHIVFVAALFFLIALAVYSGIQNQELNKVLLEYLKKMVTEFEGKGTCETIFMIFANNLLVSFLGIILGVFFAVIPVIFVISNGYALGFIAQKSVDIAGIAILWRLFPHGIFELPAVFISLALGIKLGMFVFARQPWKELKIRFFKSMKVFFYIVLPLLVIAAIIEGILIVVAG